MPGTEREAVRVSRQLQKLNTAVLLKTQAMATEATVLAVDRPRILHLATHGFFLPTRPAASAGVANVRGQRMAVKRSAYPPELGTYESMARSGLALAGANGQGTGDSDGILTALEVLSLDLRGTELVVLSACETGLGLVTQAQGVYGLRRSFREAGAEAVLSTLWAVDDDATAALMQRFYNRFMNGERPARALQNTQRELLESRQWDDPFYWAPFTMIGGS